MAKANPKAWFPGCTARISYKSVGKYERQWEKYKPFFSSWGEAHAYLLKRAEDRLAKAQAELKSAAAHRAKVKSMTEPVGAKAGETKACWSCKRAYTAEQRGNADGNCPHCGAEIEETGEDA